MKTIGKLFQIFTHTFLTKKGSIQATEMKYLRRMLEVKRTDRIKNNTIRYQLELAPISKAIAERKL